MYESQQGLLARLDPELLGYATSQFRLKDDLDHLIRVNRADAPEAVIFYCARILETLAGDALQRLGQEPSTNVFSNLEVLEHLDRLKTATRYWAHALRRLGNKVRHIDGFVGPGEADLCIQFVERWLDWFFRRFSHGCKLPCLTRDQRSLCLGDGNELSPLLMSVEDLELMALDRSTGEWDLTVADCPMFLQTPVLPAAASEILLGRKEDRAAFRILDAGLSRFPQDLRLRQLMGLYWRRKGHLENALEPRGGERASSPGRRRLN